MAIGYKIEPQRLAGRKDEDFSMLLKTATYKVRRGKWLSADIGTSSIFMMTGSPLHEGRMCLDNKNKYTHTSLTGAVVKMQVPYVTVHDPPLLFTRFLITSAAAAKL